jgi:hypothetical protein
MINDYLNNVSREANAHFKNERMVYLKDKINMLETNSEKNNKNGDLLRGTSDFKKAYPCRTNLVK